jgi:2-oxoglutarate dehydrogenase E2 component (dihydrolipoamide succinyltransferase)
MILEIKIPSPGESITEAQLSTWLVNDGDYVFKDQEMAEIESDKATLPLIAADSGRVKFLAQAGDTVKIGAIACTIDTSAEKPIISKKPEVLAPVVLPEIKKEEKSKPNEDKKEAALKDYYEKIKISPIAKSLMDENNLSVDDIINGLKRIGKAEVETVLNQKLQPTSLSAPVIQDRADDRKKMTPLRKKLSERLVAVKNQTAMLTTFNEVDMSEVMALRKKYQAKFEEKHGIKVGLMSFFTKAASEALKLHPNVNSMIDGDDIITPNYTDIAIAVQTDKGLTVPVLRGVENMSLADIEKKIAELAAKARAARLSMEEMTGGTFTITNGGVFGSLLSTPIINPPQSAILGMHNILERPVAVNGQVVIRPMMYIALSYDHRIIDGKDSVGFLVHVKQFIENPVKLLFGGDKPEKLLLGI